MAGNSEEILKFVASAVICPSYGLQHVARKPEYHFQNLHLKYIRSERCQLIDMIQDIPAYVGERSPVNCSFLLRPLLPEGATT